MTPYRNFKSWSVILFCCTEPKPQSHGLQSSSTYSHVSKTKTKQFRSNLELKTSTLSIVLNNPIKLNPFPWSIPIKLIRPKHSSYNKAKNKLQHNWCGNCHLEVWHFSISRVCQCWGGIDDLQRPEKGYLPFCTVLAVALDFEYMRCFADTFLNGSGTNTWNGWK